MSIKILKKHQKLIFQKYFDDSRISYKWKVTLEIHVSIFTLEMHVLKLISAQVTHETYVLILKKVLLKKHKTSKTHD